MKLLLALLCLATGITSKAAWTDINSGIDDDLTGIVFWGDNGLVAGHKGLYYTTTGGVGPSTWTHFEITGNPVDSITYSHTKFSHAFATTTHTNYAFACGQDTVNQMAVIFQFHIPTQAYVKLYQGIANTKLNNLRYSTESAQYYAVGDNGLLVHFNLNVDGVTESSGGILDYESVFFVSNRIAVGTENYHTFGTDNDPGISVTSQSKPGVHLKDIWLNNTGAGYGVGDSFYQVSYPSGNVTAFPNYNFGPLNATSIHRLSTYYFIGTDHGIFRCTNIAAIEWQPSSLQHFIYDFWNQPSTTKIYACGKNGVILSTTDNGGPSLPYMKVTEGGGCKGQTLTMSGTYGTATSCQWFLNGALVSSSCSNYVMAGNTPGMHQIQFKGTNGAGTDSAMTYFYVVDTPQINLPFVVNDTMLCKKEPVMIDIDQSETNVYYQLIKAIGSPAYGNSAVGNGALLNYVTDSISQSGDYLLKANSSLAACSVKFTDTIEIYVEHTKAAFHVSNTNLIPGEETHLFETCTDANNYAWEFPAGATFLTSNLPDPVNSFSLPGNQTVKLICWSDNFCYDSIVGPGPTVYLPPAVYDSCWVNQSNGDDPTWYGQLFPEIADLTPLSDGGYLMSGTYHDHSFGSTYGDSLQIDWFGAYLNKYDKHGVYKWNVHAIGAGNGFITAGSNYNKFSIKSTAVDADGNIYGCGYFEDFFVDNEGDTILSPGGFGQIFKLDSLGKTIWRRSADALYPINIAVDYDGNIVVNATRNSTYYSGGVALTFNGVASENLPWISDVNFDVIKFASDGTLMWDVPIDIDYVNPIAFLGVKFDAQNNVYLAGSYEQSATFYSTGVTQVLNNLLISSGEKMFLSKFNSDGELLWAQRSYTQPGSDNTFPRDLSVDAAGNCYVSGTNSCYVPSKTHYFENTDNTLTSHASGISFILKVDSSGICNWMRGNVATGDGVAYQIETINDSIYTIGQFLSSPVKKFINPDGSSITVDIAPADYFMAVYDTAGYLYRIVKNGSNTNEVQTNTFTEFFRGADGHFYAARNGNTFSGPFIFSFEDFGDSITQLNGREGWVTKFCEACGITQEAGYTEITDTTVCYGSVFTFPDGNTAIMMAEAHDTVTFTAINSMDSIVITNVYVNGYADQVDSVFICYNGTYTFPDGAIISGLIADTTHLSLFQTSLGCDSNIVTILKPFPEVINVLDAVTICYNTSYTFLDGTVQSGITTEVIHDNIFTTVNGCDSIITTVVTPMPLIANEIDSVSVCYGSDYAFPDGFVATNITTQITHDSYFMSAEGCDSIIETLVSPANEIVNTVTQSTAMLSSNHPSGAGVSYQWVDCLAGYAHVPGETAVDFTPVSDGNYAVIIQDNGCTDTSACQLFLGTGFDEQTPEVLVYPNPTDGQVYIVFKNVTDFTQVQILNSLGQQIAIHTISEQTMVITLPDANGIYYLRFVATDKPIFYRIITKM